MRERLRVLIVGQGPGPNHSSDRALDGPGSGNRLAKLCGVDRCELLTTCDTTNLLKRWYGKRGSGRGDEFPLDVARRSAERIKLFSFPMYDRVVLLGRNVARAFGMSGDGILSFTVGKLPAVIVVPHPSGINQWYNHHKNRKETEKILRWAIKDASPLPKMGRRSGRVV